jgi:hypothetical protein
MEGPIPIANKMHAVFQGQHLFGRWRRGVDEFGFEFVDFVDDTVLRRAV